MQVCTSLQTDNHANTSLLSFLQAGCPSCRPTNSVKALKALFKILKSIKKFLTYVFPAPRRSSYHRKSWTFYDVVMELLP